MHIARLFYLIPLAMLVNACIEYQFNNIVGTAMWLLTSFCWTVLIIIIKGTIAQEVEQRMGIELDTVRKLL